jgi:hypothetical protein
MTEAEYALKIQQRHKNYVEYYETVEPNKRYSLTELMELDELELLALMPNNHCVNEHSEAFGHEIMKCIVGFQIHKVIDGSWHIGYYEGNRDKLNKDQLTLLEICYVKNLKIGLIDLFLMLQNLRVEHWNGVKSGRIKLSLGDSWDDRKALKLPEITE